VIETLTIENKRKIRELEHRKIDLNEQLALTTSVERFKAIEEELYEINDTIKILTRKVA
jgi:predicted  nucleic acid-binding Zn-ribbon protein